MIMLTWTPMNIDAYISNIYAGLKNLQELVCNMYDMIENRVEKNLMTVSKTFQIDLLENASFTYQTSYQCNNLIFLLHLIFFRGRAQKSKTLFMI